MTATSAANAASDRPRQGFIEMPRDQRGLNREPGSRTQVAKGRPATPVRDRGCFWDSRRKAFPTARGCQASLGHPVDARQRGDTSKKLLGLCVSRPQPRRSRSTLVIAAPDCMPPALSAVRAPLRRRCARRGDDPAHPVGPIEGEAEAVLRRPPFSAIRHRGGEGHLRELRPLQIGIEARLRPSGRTAPPGTAGTPRHRHGWTTGTGAANIASGGIIATLVSLHLSFQNKLAAAFLGLVAIALGRTSLLPIRQTDGQPPGWARPWPVW
jgi:hypothetical protein